MLLPYSEDLCWRVVWLYLLRNMSYREIAELTFLSEKTVQKYVQSYVTTNSVAPASQKHGPAKLLSEFEHEFLLQSLIASPGIYLHELCEKMLLGK